jgi:hypothetical protein
MIGVKLHGRLGNQMFQYAFVMSVAKQFNTFFFIDKNNGTNLLFKYFKLSSGFRYFNGLLKKGFKKKGKIFSQIGHENVNEILFSVRNSTYYEVFCQSLLYFEQVENLIKESFRIKDIYVKEFNKKYDKLLMNNKTIVIHFRGSDYFEWRCEELGGENFVLPLIFYEDCLKKINNIEQYKIIFISDSISILKKHFGDKENYYFESNAEIVDFQLMINANILIISNSSYAWWGAFLNNKNAEIYAPKYWLGFKVRKEYPVGIMEKLNWNFIEVTL